MHRVGEAEGRWAGCILARLGVAAGVGIAWGAALAALGLPYAVVAIATAVVFCAAGLALAVAAATAASDRATDG